MNLRASMLPMLVVFLFGCRPAVPPPPPAPPVQQPSKLARHDGRWILIEAGEKMLTVVENGAPLAVMDRVAFGAAGVGTKHRSGDDVTPRGSFVVQWVNERGKFGPFIGLSFPNEAYAEQGLKERVISPAQYRAITQAITAHEKPPQDTKLGGLIGIHGVGAGSLAIHHRVNWTSGCVALDNQQIKRLLPFVRVGMIVEIE